jgi:hypothetical protein
MLSTYMQSVRGTISILKILEGSFFRCWYIGNRISSTTSQYCRSYVRTAGTHPIVDYTKSFDTDPPLQTIPTEPLLHPPTHLDTRKR